jgi:hypothetical protein
LWGKWTRPSRPACPKLFDPWPKRLSAEGLSPVSPAVLRVSQDWLYESRMQTPANAFRAGGPARVHGFSADRSSDSGVTSLASLDPALARLYREGGATGAILPSRLLLR